MVSLTRPIPQIPQCTCPIFHNASILKRNVSIAVLNCTLGIWNRRIVAFVRSVYSTTRFSRVGLLNDMASDHIFKYITQTELHHTSAKIIYHVNTQLTMIVVRYAIDFYHEKVAPVDLVLEACCWIPMQAHLNSLGQMYSILGPSTAKGRAILRASLWVCVCAYVVRACVIALKNCTV